MAEEPGTGSEASNGWGCSSLHSFAGIRKGIASASTNQRDAGPCASAGELLAAKLAAPVTRPASLVGFCGAETAVPAWDEESSLSTGARPQRRRRRRRGFTTSTPLRRAIGRPKVTEASLITQDHCERPYHDAQPHLVRAAAWIIPQAMPKTCDSTAPSRPTAYIRPQCAQATPYYPSQPILAPSAHLATTAPFMLTPKIAPNRLQDVRHGTEAAGADYAVPAPAVPLRRAGPSLRSESPIMSRGTRSCASTLPDATRGRTLPDTLMSASAVAHGPGVVVNPTSTAPEGVYRKVRERGRQYKFVRLYIDRLGPLIQVHPGESTPPPIPSHLRLRYMNICHALKVHRQSLYTVPQ